MPLNVLYLAHRYRNIMINFGALLCPGPDFQPPCALWDFIQNYMNVSRPLPDLPQYEEYRHLDPTTAEYDRLTGRNPRYWIDMDDATFKQIVNDMHQRVEDIGYVRAAELDGGIRDLCRLSDKKCACAGEGSNPQSSLMPNMTSGARTPYAGIFLRHHRRMGRRFDAAHINPTSAVRANFIGQMK
jgi:hypothetical protein